MFAPLFKKKRSYPETGGKAGFRPQVDGLRIVSAVVSYRLYRFSSWLLHKQGKLVSVVSAVSLVSVVALSDGSYRSGPGHGHGCRNNFCIVLAVLQFLNI